MQLSSSLSLQASKTTVAAFSTSSTRYASVAPKKTAAQKALAARANQSKTLRIKKKAQPKATGKPPNPGDRKAMRKRVVLSNTNALVVQGLVDLSPEMVADTGLVGQVVGLAGNTVDSLRASEAFKPKQGWGLFRRPGLLVRTESVMLGERIVASEEKKKVLRLIIDGERVTGKSLMLIHALAAASVRGWVILNIPEGKLFPTTLCIQF
jgi:small subunit ribosomal protein S29